MAQNLTDEELLARIEDEESVAYGINDQELSEDRAKAIQYYFGAPLGDEIEGRSQVVSRDVLEVVEGALPQVLEVFVSGDQVVRFDPKGPEDQAAAEQETDYVNHVVMEKNEGFSIFYTWFKDAFMSKNGYVKAWYEENESYEDESYQGLTDAQLMLVTQNPEIEVLEHTAYPDPYVTAQPNNAAELMQMGAPILPPPMLHDIKIRVHETRGCVRICNVPPENMMVSVDTRTIGLQHARFVQHREYKTADEIEGMGYAVPENSGYADRDDLNQEHIARDRYNEQVNELGMSENEYLVRDTYMMVAGKRMHYVHVNRTLVDEEEIGYVPFGSLTPHLMPHRHIGMSYADLAIDVQEIKTVLIRGQLDNSYLANNGRYAISDKVNLEDMMTSRPGGLVRVKGMPGSEIMPLSHAPLPPSSFSLVEYLDATREKRTGITAYNQGLDADSLNKTKGGMQMVMNASQQRLRLVARLFAETGVKDLFWLVHRLVRTHYTKPDIVSLRNKWVEVDPRSWKTRNDLSVSVGLGTGNKDQQLMHLTTILQAQKEAAALGIATPKNIYNALVKMTQNAGFKNPDEFWTNPENAAPQPPKEDPLVAVERVKAEGQLKLQQDKNQATMAQTQQKTSLELQQRQQEVTLDAELERYKAELKAQTDFAIAQMKAQFEAQAQAQAVAGQVSNFDGVIAQVVERTDQALGSLVQDMLAHIQNKQDGGRVVSLRKVRDEAGNLVGAVQVYADGTEVPIQIE